MKKYSITSLAKALASLSLEKMSEEKEKKFAAEFLKLLYKQGMISKSEKIIELAKNYLLQKKGNRVIIVKTPRIINNLQKKLVGSFLKLGDKVSYEIDANLIAGIKIIINDEKQLDFSLKRKLEEIFN